jgi:transcriptional regulator with XRE-family HTH domain
MELRIKEILKERNITQQQLADMLGITRSAITQQLAGKPSLATLEKIAEALGVEMWELFKSKSEIVEEITEETKNTIRCPKCGARFVLDEKEEQ